MKQWYVKDLSKLTGTSVQTLHHYDRIGLLKPSFRTDSGYRVYSEEDLLKLQQILALKFFGFELAQIKTLFAGDASPLEHFSMQAKFLDEKAQALQSASKVMNSLIADMQDNKSITWKSILNSIEVYRMIDSLENSWATQVFTADELKQFAQLRLKLDQKTKDAFLKKRAKLIERARDNLANDPESEIGYQIAEAFMNTINSVYGPDDAHLKEALWHKGFKQGKIDGDMSIDPEVVEWLDKAIFNYYSKRTMAILIKITEVDQKYPEVLAQWEAMTTEVYGHSAEQKQTFFDMLMANDEVADVAKQWLKTYWKF